jgi:hypothetical protein
VTAAALRARRLPNRGCAIGAVAASAALMGVFFGQHERQLVVRPFDMNPRHS